MPSPRRCGSPSMWYMGAGWTTARADQGPPSTLAMEETTWGGLPASGQKRQAAGSRRAASGVSPVITQERVIGSLRSSICFRKHPEAAGSQMGRTRQPFFTAETPRTRSFFTTEDTKDTEENSDCWLSAFGFWLAAYRCRQHAALSRIQPRANS